MARLAGKARHYTVGIIDHQGNATNHTWDFPSVTSILDAVVAKPKLMHWYYSTALKGMAQLVQKYGGKLPGDYASLKSLMGSEKLSPYSQRDKAASTGTDVHEDLERLAAGEVVERTSENAGLLDWWAERGLTPADVIATEIPLVSFKYRYAGTVDLIYKDPSTGKVRLCDLKTGKYVHWTHFVQGEAYRRAYEEEGGWVDEVTVLHCPAAQEGVYTEKVSTEIDFSVFESILGIFNWLPEDWLPEDAE